jgi:hypothetical protein|tara:strand:+ start:5371 stop:6246 length:876 start_codon:yes stop_codon:yes gene_type:complete
MGFKNYAVDVYGPNTGSIKLPKQKYQYAVEFLTDLAENKMMGRQFNVSTVSLPSVQYQTQTNNSYNRKVISILNKQYSPVTMTIRDDREGVLNQFLSEYDQHYFGKPSSTRSTDMRNTSFQENENLKIVNRKDPINMIMIHNFSGTSDTGQFAEKIPANTGDPAITGFDPGTLVFANTVEPQSYGQNTYMLYRPVITNVGRDTLSYADSSIVEFSISFEYEYFEVEFVPGAENKQPIAHRQSNLHMKTLAHDQNGTAVNTTNTFTNGDPGSYTGADVGASSYAKMFNSGPR